MNLDRYDLTVGESQMIFEFTSEGPKGTTKKVVIYSKTHLHNFYNLGFGDKDNETGFVDDLAVTNNGDRLKVLATVAATVVVFSNQFPDASIFATGSTKARTRLYRIGIGSIFEEIKLNFDVYGLLNNEWLPISKNVEFEGFLIRKKLNLQNEKAVKQ